MSENEVLFSRIADRAKARVEKVPEKRVKVPIAKERKPGKPLMYCEHGLRLWRNATEPNCEICQSAQGRKYYANYQRKAAK